MLGGASFLLSSATLYVLRFVLRKAAKESERIFQRLILTQLLVDGLELLAVSAPGRVELDEGVLAVVGDDLVEVLGYGDLDVAAVLRDRLGLLERLEVIRLQVLHELLEALDAELLAEDELLVALVARQDYRLVALHVVHVVLVKLVLELVLVGDRERVVGKVLGDFPDAVAPVVRTLGVLHVVDRIVGDDQRLLEFLGVVVASQSDEAVAKDHRSSLANGLRTLQLLGPKLPYTTLTRHPFVLPS
jgi:hypothetical protein